MGNARSRSNHMRMDAPWPDVSQVLDEFDLLGKRDDLGRDIRNMLRGAIDDGDAVGGELTPRPVDPHADMRALITLRERLRTHLAHAEAVHASDPCCGNAVYEGNAHRRALCNLPNNP